MLDLLRNNSMFGFDAIETDRLEISHVQERFMQTATTFYLRLTGHTVRLDVTNVKR